MQKEKVLACLAVCAAAGTLCAGDWLLDPAPYKSAIRREGAAIVLDNGLVRREITVRPGVATTSLTCLSTGEEFVRAVSPEARIVFDGVEYMIGGLSGQPILNYLMDEWLAGMKPAPGAYEAAGAAIGDIEPRLEWKKREEWLSRPLDWPPKGKHLALAFRPPAGKALPAVTVHYEIYDGAPVFSKWFTVSNGTDRAVRIDGFTSEELRLAETSGMQDVEHDPPPFNIHVESDYGFLGDGWRGRRSPAFRFGKDGDYRTQESQGFHGINTLRCGPEKGKGPGVTIAPGGTFESLRVWETIFDSTERERRGLALRRMYRIVAPWTCENPIFFHKTTSKPEDIRDAIAQCKATGFEMIIMSFYSGFNLESRDPKYRATYKTLADEARAAGIALGGYTLTSSRPAPVKEGNLVNPRPVWGKGPCLCSKWGREYFENVKSFMDEAGFGVLENDGPFPGDWCAATNHPYHSGKGDSVWLQWEAQRRLFRHCRARGIYVNMPDGYFMDGASKTGGGYKEKNWTLPLAQQLIIERQNVYDNNWTRNTSMHWAFVPLTAYHNGGPESVVEPLAEHLAHYEARFANLLCAGVHAFWRGSRLYDTPVTLAMVKRRVAFYKKYRGVFDGDMIHLRRPDGRDWDGWLMVDPTPGGGVRAIATLFNPTGKVMRRRISLPLYYAGLSGEAEIAIGDETAFRSVRLDGSCRAALDVEISANGHLHVFCRKKEDGK